MKKKCIFAREESRIVMRKYTVWVVLLAGLFAVQCTNNRVGPAEQSFTLDGVREIAVARFREYPQFDLGNPMDVIALGGGKVLVSDQAPLMLHYLDLTTGSDHAFLNQGRGPGELSLASTVEVQGDLLYAFSPNDRKIVCLRLDESQDFPLVSEIKTEVFSPKMAVDPKGGFVMSPTRGGLRFVHLDNQGNVTDTLGSFPQVEGEQEAINNNSLQSNFAFSPDGKYFCSPYLGMDCIEIYSHDFKSVTRLMGPEDFRPTVKKIVFQGGEAWTYGASPDKRVFSGVSTSDKGFIVIYIGQLRDSDESARRNTLLRFDWQGRCLARYVLPEDIYYYDIDWEQGKLIAISARPERTLVVADIDL